MLEETIGSRGRHLFSLTRRPINFVHSLLNDTIILLRGQQISLSEKALEACNGIFGSPALDLASLTIARRVISSSMGTDAVGKRLDQRWTLTVPRTFHSLAHRFMNGQDIVAIDQHGWHAKASATSCQRG